MSHHQHHNTEDRSLDSVYYIVAVLSGMFTGAIIDKGIIWVVVGAVLGLLTAAFFLKSAVRGRWQD
ncbi:hypothetical protein MUY27_19750 [Mucilaginibacter sp. RS28]|uniref:Uncharacterized protein n=1 Tax=Mucilaginibacter straminoryzae TaxID=2932774 RepID=A0A9X1X6C6_9SPHI|nr:hypothetical protein [Mucilaginibacter straminoryzae]MCJ8211962.1 hypothetical protein [Mucilaginibacter straminoryzae]